MTFARRPTLLALAIAFLLAVASGAGIWVESVYAKETASWAAQGVGQDFVTLFLVAPALLICTHFAYRGSIKAFLVWLGLLLYVVYSYVLYAFFVHFNFLFPAYVAILGLSFYALLASVAGIDLDGLARRLDASTQAKPVGIFLLIVAMLFGALWLADITSALLAGRVPASLEEVGLPVNPVHVLDLAFLLPGMTVTAVLLRRRRPLGFLFAAPLLVFTAAMGAAIMAMSWVMHGRGLPASLGVSAMMGMLVLISLFLTYRFLSGIRA
jgi:hypothetical protein